MKTLLTISLLAFLTLTRAQAEAEKTPAVELKSKSAFAMEASGRNPFWPIGWKPVAKLSATDAGGAEIQPAAFVVSSITFDKGARVSPSSMAKRCRRVSNLDCNSATRPISSRSKRSKTAG